MKKTNFFSDKFSLLLKQECVCVSVILNIYSNLSDWLTFCFHLVTEVVINHDYLKKQRLVTTIFFYLSSRGMLAKSSN